MGALLTLPVRATPRIAGFLSVRSLRAAGAQRRRRIRQLRRRRDTIDIGRQAIRLGMVLDDQYNYNLSDSHGGLIPYVRQ